MTFEVQLFFINDEKVTKLVFQIGFVRIKNSFLQRRQIPRCRKQFGDTKNTLENLILIRCISFHERQYLILSIIVLSRISAIRNYIREIQMQFIKG